MIYEIAIGLIKGDNGRLDYSSYNVLGLCCLGFRAIEEVYGDITGIPIPTPRMENHGTKNGEGTCRLALHMGL